MSRAVVAVAGSFPCSDAEAELAHSVGRLLAGRGAVVVTGGRGGVMEAASRGAKEAGGLTVGLLPGDDDAEANPYLDVALPTGLGESRNILVAKAGRTLIAIGMGFGTLSEVAFALKANRRVVVLASWDLTKLRPDVPRFAVATSPEEAVSLALSEG